MDHLITRETPDRRCLRCNDWTRHVWWDLAMCVPCRKLLQAKQEATMTPNEYQKLAARTEKTPRLLRQRWLVETEDGFVPTDDDGWATATAAQGLRVVDMDLLLHSLMGCTTEVGEAMDMDKKHMMYGKPFDPVNVLEEFGDKLWYIACGLRACGFTMQECMERNIEKLRKRFPDGFAEDKALNRDLDAERKALEEK